MSCVLKHKQNIRKNIFACLFSIHNTISLSRREQVILSGLRFERYFSHQTHLNLLAHDVINLLYYKQNIFFLFSIQNIKSYCYISFLDFFPMIFFWWKIHSYLFIFIYKMFSFSKNRFGYFLGHPLAMLLFHLFCHVVSNIAILFICILNIFMMVK